MNSFNFLHLLIMKILFVDFLVYLWLSNSMLLHLLRQAGGKLVEGLLSHLLVQFNLMNTYKRVIQF